MRKTSRTSSIVFLRNFLYGTIDFFDEIWYRETAHLKFYKSGKEDVVDGKTKTNREFLIAIIGAGSDPHYMRYSSSLGIIKTPVIVIERLLEKPLELESAEILEKIPILPLKFSHHAAPKIRHDRSTIKNYDKKLRAKSKRLQNKKGRG